MKLKALLVAVAAMMSCAGCGGSTSSPNTANAIKDVTVRVADDLCSAEASQPNEADLVKLACQAENVIVHVILPLVTAQTAAPKATMAAKAIKAQSNPSP